MQQGQRDLQHCIPTQPGEDRVMEKYSSSLTGTGIRSQKVSHISR